MVSHFINAMNRFPFYNPSRKRAYTPSKSIKSNDGTLVHHRQINGPYRPLNLCDFSIIYIFCVANFICRIQEIVYRTGPKLLIDDFPLSNFKTQLMTIVTQFHVSLYILVYWLTIDIQERPPQVPHPVLYRTKPFTFPNRQTHSVHHSWGAPYADYIARISHAF